ncbi:hypothetical protein GCM10011415_01150 [Salipiger pallidus]|uniref:Uncharacterized protein n=1 Tax=Salipiger pallidus TaxID=1775170 RepID=A0A8J2ZFT6_9RHOB|nr:DUF533 domain-containing protein [Salipiger pallidus]GGG59094.1 hypothetical protein GCM10011415_01150 [Salipiger pallidus]
MGMMKTLAKVAIGYAAARGVDRMSGGRGIGGLMGGKAQLKGSEPGTAQQAQLGQMMGGGGLSDMVAKFQQGGLGAMMGGAGQGAGLAGMLSAAGGAAAAGGAGVGALLDQFNKTGATSPEAEAIAGLMLRAMIQAAKSDGEIDAAEKARIVESVGEDATPEDMAFVRDQLSAPLDPEGLAKDTPETAKPQVYSAALMTIVVDTDEEAEFLDRLAKSMGLSETVVNQLHMQMGVQPLYA